MVTSFVFVLPPINGGQVDMDLLAGCDILAGGIFIDPPLKPFALPATDN